MTEDVPVTESVPAGEPVPEKLPTDNAFRRKLRREEAKHLRE